MIETNKEDMFCTKMYFIIHKLIEQDMMIYAVCFVRLNIEHEKPSLKMYINYIDFNFELSI